jgi:hypothetical protein
MLNRKDSSRFPFHPPPVEPRQQNVIDQTAFERFDLFAM